MQEYPELENFRLDRHRISSHDLKFYIPVLDIIYRTKFKILYKSKY